MPKGRVQWTDVAPGVWKAVLGKPEDLTPLGVVAAEPRREALAALGQPPFPLDPKRIAAERVGGRLVVRLPLGEDEKLYGLGLQFLKLNHRGRTRYLRVNSDPIQDTGETHAPVPFLVSSRGYGVLADTARIVTVYCGSTVRKDSALVPVLKDRGRDADWQDTPASDLTEVVVAAPGVTLYVFAGPSLLDAVRRYNLFCGGGVLPPRWGLGFWHRVHYWHDARKTLDEAAEIRRRGFPCDVIGLEPGWLSKSYPTSFEWGADRFPDPRGFVEALRAQGFRVNLWENHWVSPASRIYRELEPLSGSHTAWGGLAVDHTLPEARALVQRQHEQDHVRIGVAGYKLDECDGSELTGCAWMFPAHATFPSGHDGEQLRQVYGLLLQKLTGELFRRAGRRTWGLVRASNAGASSLPYVLYSDLYDHRQYVRALCNAGFSGLLWTPEVRGAESPEEWARRIQVVCFSPLAMLNAWGNEAKPWSHPAVEAVTRKYLELRMRLLPYFYSAFARYYFDGTPPFRALALDLDPARVADAGAWNADDQYLAGDALLVAPLFAGETERDVFLPPGDWYDFETGARLEGGRRVRVAAPVDKLPVFVRDGGIVPLMPPLQHAPAAGEAVPLEVRHYGRAPGRFRLFDDDGETFAYEQGGYRWRTLEVSVGPDGARRGSVTAAEPGWASSYGEVTWRFFPPG